MQVLDRSKTLPISFDASAPDMEAPAGRGFHDCVRDVSWHSKEPVMMSAAWSARGHSTVARHEWKGLAKMGGRLEDWVEKTEAEAEERRRPGTQSSRSNPRRSRRALPGSFTIDDDDEAYGNYVDY